MTSQEQQLLLAVDASQVDPSLPLRSVSIPAQSNVNWGLIVAVHGPTWNGRFSPAKLFWDQQNNQIKISLMAADAPMSLLDDVETFLQQNIFSNDTEFNRLDQEARELISSDTSASASKRQRDGDEVDQDAYAARPANPATVSDDSSLAATTDSTATDASASAAAAAAIDSQPNPFADIQQQQTRSLAGGSIEKEITVRQDRVGLLIGQSGKTIRLLKSITGAAINIDQGNIGSERRITLSGSVEQVEAAELQIKMVLLLSQQTVDMNLLPPGSTSECIQIPSDAVGAVIGKQGDTIRLLQIFSHAHIAMEKEEPGAEQSPNRTVTLSGTPLSIEKAKKAITNLVQQYKDSRGDTSVRFDPQTILFGQPPTCSRTIIIDNNIVGHVIGTKGANFNQIRQETGCQIQADKNIKNPKRELTITGPTENAVRSAVQAITTIVKNAQQSVGQRSSNMFGGQQQQGGNQYGGDDNRRNNNNNNNNRGGPSLHQQPQQMGGFGHQRMPPHQQHMAQGMAAAAGGYAAAMQHQPQQYGGHMQPQQQHAHQQYQQHLQPPPPQVPVPGGKPQPTKPLPADKMASFYSYYDHYVKSYPPAQAIQFAEYYIDNPPK